MMLKKQKGLSLIEIQVALVIGLILTAGAAQLFISNQQTNRSENALTRMQQNGRFIVDTISRDIRMAGYTGCTSREGSAPITETLATPLPYSVRDVASGNLTNVLVGTDDGGGSRSPALSGNLGGTPIDNIFPGTDTITVQRAHQCGAALWSTAASTGANISLYSPNQCNLGAGEGAMITNCGRSDVFEINTASADAAPFQTLTSVAPLSSTYGEDAFVYQFLSNTYYIAPSQFDANTPALWVDQWDPSAGGYTSVELADGVEDFQIQYGVDTGGDQYPDTYQDTDGALDMTTVRSVRINLLLRSLADNITTAPQQFNFLGNPANAGGDRRLRTVYTSTVTIRNQLP